MATDLEALRAELLVTAKVQNGEREFQVSGLPLKAILDICRRNWDAVGEVFDNMMSQVESGQGISIDQASWLGEAVLSSVPRVAAEIITAAAGWSIDAVDIVEALPFPVQMDALDKIAALTFTTEMPPKKVIEIVVRMLGGVSKTLIGSEAA